MPKPRKVKPESHDHLAMVIASQLKTLRKKRGFTQTELAMKIGLTQKAVAAYEAGRVRILDITLVDIARALHVSTDEILGMKPAKQAFKDISLRLVKRMNAIDSLPETTKKHILKTIDDSIKANNPA
jgi:transcriptional regulator with XRE-family HTH domain